MGHGPAAFPPVPPRWQTWAGRTMGAVMWFWIMYRAKQDGPVLIGARHPWEGHGHGADHKESHH